MARERRQPRALPIGLLQARDLGARHPEPALVSRIFDQERGIRPTARPAVDEADRHRLTVEGPDSGIGAPTLREERLGQPSDSPPPPRPEAEGRPRHRQYAQPDEEGHQQARAPAAPVLAGLLPSA